MVKSQRSKKSSEVILEALTEKSDVSIVANKLVSLLEKTLLETSGIGKSNEEVAVLLGDIGSDIESESKKSSRKYKERTTKKSSRSGRSPRRRHDDGKIRRGTGRGEVPEPTVSSVGGSRIVARKLF